MPVIYKNFNTPNGSINMEVSEIDPTSNSTGLTYTVEDAFATINNIAQLVSKGMGKLPKAITPSEIEVNFSIQALQNDNMAIASSSNGNFNVKLKWGGVGGEFEDILGLNN